jgi:hypothetical protein
MKTPRGWSILVVQPLNRFDLPWTITSGIMDTDQYSTSGNIPFFIREDFDGIIAEGTPIAQVIPFKRQDWKSEIDDDNQANPPVSFLNNVFNPPFNFYKRTFWKRKKYQ